jgi:hypothetical protein
MKTRCAAQFVAERRIGQKEADQHHEHNANGAARGFQHQCDQHDRYRDIGWG